MDHRELIHWLREARAQGLSDMEIQRHLHDAGLTHKQINVLLVSGYVPIGESESLLDTVEGERALILPPARAVFRQSLVIFKQRARTLMAIAFFFIIPFILFLAACGFVSNAIINASESTAARSLADCTGGALIALLGMAVAAIIAGSLMLAWLQSSVTVAIVNPDGALTAAATIRKSWQHIRSVWWTMLLAAAMTTGGAVLAVIPGIVFMVEFAFSHLFPVTDNTGGSRALMISKYYSRRAIVPLLSRFIALLVPLAMVLTVLGCGTASLSSRIGITGSFAHSVVPPFLSCGIIGIAAILSLPIVCCYTYVLFQYLKKQQAVPDELHMAKRDAKVVTTAIIGWALLPVVFMVIVGIGTHQLDQVRAHKRNTERRADIDTLHNALMLYSKDNGSFPASLDELTVGYIAPYPRDPENGESYQYELYGGDGFKLCATLEREEDANTAQYCRH